MAKRTKSPCVDTIRKAADGELTTAQAEDIIDKVIKKYTTLDEAKLLTHEDRVTEMKKDMVGQDKLFVEAKKRGVLLSHRTNVEANAKVDAHKLDGDGLYDFVLGEFGIANQAFGIFKTLTKKLVTGLEDLGVTREIRSMALDREILNDLDVLGGVAGAVPSGNSTAKATARIFFDLHAKMFDRSNRAGAFKRFLADYRMMQVHDPSLIRSVDYDVWVKDVMDNVDPARTFNGQDTEKWLKEAYDGITSGKHATLVGAEIGDFKSSGSLANSVSASRKFHFKDADSFFEYHKKYSGQSLLDMMLGEIERNSRAIALMENLGTNPKAGLARLIEQRERIASRSDNADARMKSIKKKSKKVDDAFKDLTGESREVIHQTLHTVGRFLREVQNVSKMGGSGVTATITDPVYLISTAMNNGISMMDATAAVLTMHLPKSANSKLTGSLTSVAFDSFISSSGVRHSGPDYDHGSFSKVSKLIHTLSGLNKSTDNSKTAASRLFLHNLGENSHLRLDDLPVELSRVLSQYDIRAGEWDAMRSTAFKVDGENIMKMNDSDGVAFITSDQFVEIPDSVIGRLARDRGWLDTGTNRQRVRDSLETKFMTYLSDQVDTAVPTPGAAQRVKATQGLKPGTPVRVALDFFMQYKSFPITIWDRIIKRDWDVIKTNFKNNHGIHKILNKGTFNTALLIAHSTVGGYLAMTAHDLRKGRGWRKLTNDDGSINGKILREAMARGGALGLYGDVLFDEYDRGMGNIVTKLSGPVIGQAPELFATATDIMQGKGISRRSIEKLGRDNIPFINLYYLRPVLDYLILWDIQEMMEPGSLTRTERNAEQNNNQNHIFKPSQVRSGIIGK